MSTTIQARRLRALFTAVIELIGHIELHDVLKDVAAAARSLTGSRYAALGILDPTDPDNMADFVTAGVPPATGKEKRSGSAPDSFPLLDPSGSLIFDPSAPERTPVEHLAAHIKLEQRTFGTIYVFDPYRRQSYDEQDAAVLEALAAAASASVQNIYLKRALTEATVRNDRARIARDLHDDVIQRLFAVGLQLQASLRTIVDHDARASISQSIDDLDQTIQQIRTTIFDLEHSGTNSTRAVLIELTSELADVAGLSHETLFQGPVDTMIGPELRPIIVKAAREMLSNVVKHANAGRVIVTVKAAGSRVTLAVSDDGIGYDPGTAPAGGLGLKNLASRAAALDGSFSIRALLGGGSVATFEIPFDEPAPQGGNLVEA